jgi:predicted Zn-dependent protease
MLTIVRALGCAFPPLLLGLMPLAAAPPKPPAAPPLADTLARELARNFTILKAKADPAPYFLAYSVEDVESAGIVARGGALVNRSSGRRRALACSVRVGTPQLDNYHLVDGDRPRAAAAIGLPIDDAPDAIARLAWRTTDRAWRAAAQRLSRVRSSAQLRAGKNAEVADFSVETPAKDARPVARYRFPLDEWAGRIKRLSAGFAEFPGVLVSGASLSWRREVKTYVDSTGARVEHGRNYFRIEISGLAKGYDGNDVTAFEAFEAEDPAHLPKQETLDAAVKKVGQALTLLLRAQPAEPYVGPAVLSGRAAGVFFHEIFGHRVEGQRQRDETEGQTFTNSIGKLVLPEFLSVTFDPTRHSAAGTDLNGWYDYDDEGVPARPVQLVEKGVLKTFLMSRMPIAGLDHSNGHGRAQVGMEPVSRQSNLIVESARQVPERRLREMLIEEARKQNKPYGLFFDVVTGGYTTTRRAGLQGFTVIPLVVYRVYADGRPDEIVRGADIVGTPLASFSRILATSDTLAVFNGYCGAESGSVPVSAVSPALLVSEIEIQRKPDSRDTPPLLPRPRSEVTR